MNKLLAFLFAVALPFAAQPQAMSYATANRVVASGFVTIGVGNTFSGVKAGTSVCNGFNDTFGSYLASTLDARLMFGSGVGMPCAISLAGTYDIKVVLNRGAGPAMPQNYFTYIRIVDCASAVRIYTSSTATYSTNATSAIWQWGTGSSVVFNASSCPGAPLLMTFFR